MIRPLEAMDKTIEDSRNRINLKKKKSHYLGHLIENLDGEEIK